MSRSSLKMPFSEVTLKRKRVVKANRQEIWSRASTILPTHLGEQFYVHNGKGWTRVQIAEQMIGHKYGEFASTRKKAVHKPKVSSQRNTRKS